MGSIHRRLTATLFRLHANTCHNFTKSAQDGAYTTYLSLDAFQGWSAGSCWPSACQEQRRCKAKAIRISRKAASKGMQSSIMQKQLQKQSMQHVQDKLTIDSPQLIIGYHDALPGNMPWTWIGTFQWLWNRDNRQTMITETVRSQQIRSLLKDSYKQEEGDIITYCRSLYVRIKDSYPRHVVPSKHLTKECDDAMSKEIAALKRENMSVIDFKPDGVPEARILQYRVFPIPKQKIMIFQVCMQLKANEVHTIKSAAGVQDIRLQYQPIWVLTKIADVDPAKAANAKDTQFGGWKLSARINDHAIGKGELGQRSEVTGMVPKGQARSQINQVWEQTLFCLQSDHLTWQSWALRIALGLPKLG